MNTKPIYRPPLRFLLLGVVFWVVVVVVVAASQWRNDESRPPTPAPLGSDVSRSGSITGGRASADGRLVAIHEDSAYSRGRDRVGTQTVPETATRPLTGYATWFDAPQGQSAAGPLLREGDWRGRIVSVCAGECVTVRLTDWCACGSRNGRPTLIDLARADFAELAPPSQGVVLVRVSGAELPPTDTEGLR